MCASYSFPEEFIIVHVFLESLHKYVYQRFVFANHQRGDVILQFEWAWQHPAKSRRLGGKVGPGKRARESSLEHRFRILSEMLRVGPWVRLPLTVRWLRQEYQLDFPLDRQPPPHMPIAYGPVELTSSTKGGSEAGQKSSQTGGRSGAEEGDEERMETSSPHDASCYICHQVYFCPHTHTH